MLPEEKSPVNLLTPRKNRRVCRQLFEKGNGGVATRCIFLKKGTKGDKGSEYLTRDQG